MLVKCLLATTSLVEAQLVVPTLEELREQVAEPVDDTFVAEGFVNPTICDPSVKQTAGYISTQKGNATAPKYFFWLFESKSAPTTDPLIMWLSGGPGCSSQLALLVENGPCTIKNGKAVPNAYSWHNNANVMWVDQPAAVGFSTGSALATHNEVGVAHNMLGFMQGFYEQFPSYLQNKFYLFGESYAGHYVPAIAHKIWEHNQGSSQPSIPLTGIGIGNGLTEPQEQYKWYPKFGKDGCAAEGGHAPGVLSASTLAMMKVAMPACTAAIKLCNWCGNKAWATKLEWEGKDAFNKADDADWTSTGAVAGRKRSARGFHFMQIYDAGHLMPMDQPAVALDMVNKFISGKLGADESSLSV